MSQADFFEEESSSLPRPWSSDSASIPSVSTYRSRVSALNPLRRISSRGSTDSVDLEGARHFTLDELCSFIARHPSLQTAGIVSCSCYAQQSSFIVTHRFLILQLRRTEKRDVWLRLDRRPSAAVGIVDFSLASGVTPSNDTVCSFSFLVL